MRLITLNQATAAKRRVYFYLVDATDGLSPETGEASGQPQISTNGGAFTDTGIGTLTHMGNGRYYADLTQTAVNGSAGDVIETRYKSANTAEAPGDSVQVIAFDLDTALSSQSVASVSGAVGSVTGAVGSVTGAVGSVTGNVGGNVVGSVASVTGAVGSVTGNVGGNVVGSVASVTGAVGSVTGNVGGNVNGNVVGSVASVTGAVGSVTGNVGGNVVGSVASVTAAVAIDAASVDSIWDEPIAGHLSAGSTGAALNAAGGAGDPWATSIPGAYGAGTAGYILGNNIDAAVSSRHASGAAVASVTGNVSGNVVGSVGSVVADVGITAAAVDAVWDEPIAGHLGAGSVGEALNSAGSAGDPWSTAIPGAYGAGSAGYILGNNIDAAVSSRHAAGAAVASVTGAVGSVTGNVGGNVAGSVGSVTAGVTVATNTDKTGYALSSAGVQAIWDALTSALVTVGSIGAKLANWVLGSDSKVVLSSDAHTGAVVPTVTTLTGHTPQTGDSYALASGANGFAAIKGETAAILTDTAEIGVAGAGLTAVADTVLDEPIAGHLTAGSVGAAINAAGAAGDPWGIALPGAYGAGTAGYILGTNLDAPISAVTGLAGANAVTLHTQQSGGATIPGARLSIRDATDTTTLGVVSTDTSGDADVNLDSGTYVARAVLPGYIFDAQTFVVSGDGTINIIGEKTATSTPVAPDGCVVYGTCVTPSGGPSEGVRVKVTVLNTPKGYFKSGNTVCNPPNVSQVITDSAGYWELELVQGADVRVEIPRAGIDIERTVPATASQDISSWR